LITEVVLCYGKDIYANNVYTNKINLFKLDLDLVLIIKGG